MHKRAVNKQCGHELSSAVIARSVRAPSRHFHTPSPATLPQKYSRMQLDRPADVRSPQLPHMRGCIYLDYNATTPIYPEVASSMQPYMFEHFGNPSSIHVYGQQTRSAVDKARQQVATLINCQANEVYFTSCGTESDNWALFGTIMAKRDTVQGLPHVVTTQIEHPAITACLQNLATLGLCTYSAVPVSADGLVSPDDVVAALTPQTVLVSVMHSNNEIGSLQPIKQMVLGVKAAAPHVLVHSDAAQSMGKVTVDVQDLGVDLLTLVGHKFGAPKGVAALYMRRGVHLVNLLSGGSQEQGKRGGTENVLLLSGIGAAAEIAHKQAVQVHQHMQQMKDRLQEGLLKAFPSKLVRVNGPADPALQLPNTLSISIKGLSAPSLLQQLSEKLAASAGAACHSSHGPSVSPVLQAIQLPPDFAVGTLRLSTGRHTTAAEVDAAVQLIHDAACKQGLELDQ